MKHQFKHKCQRSLRYLQTQQFLIKILQIIRQVFLVNKAFKKNHSFPITIINNHYLDLLDNSQQVYSHQMYHHKVILYFKVRHCLVPLLIQML